MNMKLWLMTGLILLVMTMPAMSESSLSALGYGLPREVSTIRASGMGMVSLSVSDTLGLNLLSLASWEGGKTARFGLHGGYTRFTTNDPNGSDMSDIAELSGIALALPIYSDWFFGMAYSPYTKVDYHWETTSSNEWTSTLESQDGSGGITQGLIGLSIPVSKDIRIGVETRLIFGQIERSWDVTFPGTIANPATVNIKDNLRGLSWALSGRWNGPAGWFAGGYMFGPARINVKRHSFVTTIKQVSTQAGVLDTLEDRTYKLEEGYDIPLDLGIGISRQLKQNIVGLEMAYHGWGQVSEPTLMAEQYHDALRLSAGWEWDPRYKPFDPFWKSLAYRGGAYMQDHYVVSAGGNQSRKFAVTAGLSIPYYNNRSRIDIALEVGWMGSQEQDGVAERSIGLTIGFNHSERWFVNRKEKRY